MPSIPTKHTIVACNKLITIFWWWYSIDCSWIALTLNTRQCYFNNNEMKLYGFVSLSHSTICSIIFYYSIYRKFIAVPCWDGKRSSSAANSIANTGASLKPCIFHTIKVTPTIEQSRGKQNWHRIHFKTFLNCVKNLIVIVSLQKEEPFQKIYFFPFLCCGRDISFPHSHIYFSWDASDSAFVINEAHSMQIDIYTQQIIKFIHRFCLVQLT